MLWRRGDFAPYLIVPISRTLTMEGPQFDLTVTPLKSPFKCRSEGMSPVCQLK